MEPYNDGAISLLHELLGYIHDDIYVKVPRGAVKKGQNIRLTRHNDLLVFADKVRVFLDKDKI